MMERRNFMKASGLSLLGLPYLLDGHRSPTITQRANETVALYGDGPMLTAAEYAQVLQEITEKNPRVQDSYANGGAVAELEAAFARITGKPKAIFMPSGTMANQLAIKTLSGAKSKVFLQDLSHILRDEADAAQLVHNLRLMPLGIDKGSFTLEDLQEGIGTYRRKEYFRTHVGAISIENTCRRANEEIFPLDEIKRISAFAKENEIGMHLDGARLYMASAYSGVSIADYAAQFDTVYISLYKYFRAGAGAILCGPEHIIDQMAGKIKILGGNMFSNWQHAAVALHFLEGFEQRFAQAKEKADNLFASINRTSGLSIVPYENGSNKFELHAKKINSGRFQRKLVEGGILVPPAADRDGTSIFSIKINETFLRKGNDELLELIKTSYQNS